MSTSARLPFFLLLAAVTVGANLRSSVRAQVPDLSVRITSPLGRTGQPGAVRIVAQIHHPVNVVPGEVRFFVDKHLVRSVEHGPPYVAEWVDDNPFERREISVEVKDALGNEARDNVVLEPFEVTETSDVSSVLLEASVQDKSGRFVQGLPASAFTVLENDAPQKLDLVRQETVGATFALLVDSSASMSRRLDFVQRTASTLVGYMSARDRMLIAPFSRGLLPVTGPTNDRATIVEGIQAIRSEGGTAILDSLVQVSQALKTADGRRAIVLITDGYDEQSTTSFDDALAAVKSAGATLYVVGVGGVAGISIKGERLLRRLAVETGGRFFFPSRDEQLGEVHDVLTADVQNRYLISYTPENQRADGKWRPVTVRATEPGYTIRVRPGYFAPKPPPIKPALEFAAFDAQGRYMDLTSEDVEILEDGVPQKFETFQEAVEPVSIVLALDASGSMRKKEAEVIDSARRFVDALRPEDSLAVLLFSDQAVFAHDLSTKRDASHDAIKSYQAIGGTALYDALSESLGRLRSVAGRRVVIVMTDGRDENNAGTGPGSQKSFDDVLKSLKESGATLFGIGLGTKVDRVPLETLSQASGGQALFPDDVGDLDGEYRRVIEDLRRRYVIGYTSTHIERDGSWREVQIRLKSAPEVTVRSAGGYFAPER
jgi:Ca-activated chloride channel homolog